MTKKISERKVHFHFKYLVWDFIVPTFLLPEELLKLQDHHKWSHMIVFLLSYLFKELTVIYIFLLRKDKGEWL